MTKEEREEIRKQDLINFEKINQLMNALPPDMLFIIRATNLVAIHNGLLGGTTRYRLMKYTELAFNNLYTNPVERWWEKMKFYLKIFMFEMFPKLFARFYHIPMPEPEKPKEIPAEPIVVPAVALATT